MSLRSHPYVVCDLCQLEQSQEQPTGAAARRLAAQRGWTRRKGADGQLLDVGPICRAGERRRADEEAARRGR